MEILIKKLTWSLSNDYFEFFDNRAFTDNKGWSACYCVFYHWNDECAKSAKVPGIDIHEHNKNIAARFIRDDILQGYLVYIDGVVMGWCNANDKTAYETLKSDKRPELWSEDDRDMKIKSVTCYVIAPEMRRKGIATKLLERVCSDATKEGYDIVEAYPAKIKENIQKNYHGPYSLYEKCGFKVYKDLEKETIVRKRLNNE